MTTRANQKRPSTWQASFPSEILSLWTPWPPFFLSSSSVGYPAGSSIFTLDFSPRRTGVRSDWRGEMFAWVRGKPWLVTFEHLLVATLGFGLLLLVVLVDTKGNATWLRMGQRKTQEAMERPHLKAFRPTGVSRTLITGGLSPDPPSWLRSLPSDMTTAYYPVYDNSTGYVNKGNEAMFYLGFIIQHYDALPDFMVFVHDHRRAWHNSDATDRSILRLLEDLRWEYVREQGFVNLRCQRKPNCPSIVSLHGFMRPGKIETFFETAWADLFQAEFGPMPQIAATCCAQFVVTRDAVHARPLEFYRQIRAWILESPGTDWQVGRVLEYTWHIIFGRPFIHCPDEATCRRNLYGYEPEPF